MLNIQKSPAEIPWQSLVSRIFTLHQKRKEENPEWSIRRTAKEYGMSRQTVCDCLMIQARAEIEPEILMISTFRRVKAYVKSKRNQNAK